MQAAAMNQKDVNQEDLKAYVQMLGGTIGERHIGKPDALEQAAIWIESTLGQANAGYLVRRQAFETGGVDVRNLRAELPGTTRPKEIVVIGAHYDSVPGCPAANDNGSGVAAMIALARAFAGNPQQRTIQFVAFVNEEPPFFQTKEMGSYIYAKEMQANDLNVVAMLSLETIGFFSDEEGSQQYPPGYEKQFPPTGNFIAFVGNRDSKEIIDSARAAFMRATDLPALGGAFPEDVPGIGWSDHWSFWQAGYPALMVTDTAPYRYPHYHEPTDTPEKLDYEKMTEVVKGVENVIRAWANPDAEN
ncbi:MAG: M28 family peptidase [Verrucomicrobiales bacterium]|nr:M28 family peptidase [Verrucomicrobiales bacterium]